MPTISRFFGILIKMFFNDHAPPHFHVEYQDQKAVVGITTGEVIEGKLSQRVQRMVEEWRNLHVDELMEDWNLAMNKQLPKRIDPLE